MALKTTYRTPTVEEYNELRHAADWPTFPEHLVTQALLHSFFSVVIHDEHDVILGMGRVTGDNAIYIHIQDVIVRPEYQGKGIGKMIMKELLSYVETVGGKNTNIGLMCSKGREEFYKSFGFIERPSEKFGAGMIMIK